MGESSVLLGLLKSYADGDLLARRALLDWLEENGDGRAETVRREPIDWDAVARAVCPNVDPERDRRGAKAGHGWFHDDLPRYRWYVDCARMNVETLAEVRAAVRQARRHWLQGLFPEVGLLG
jgi:hypothetical protein